MRQRQYKSTRVKDRRSIVRALNNFSFQYKFIYCDYNSKKVIDLGKEVITLIFSNKPIEYMNNIIYETTDSLIKLTNYENIVETIDNLISINRKLKLKDDLKIIVDKTVINKINTNKEEEYLSVFFDKTKKDTIIQNISVLVDDNILFATKLYNQIKNRIQYDNLDLYSKNTISKNDANTISLTYITKQEIFINQIQFIKANLWLFEESQLSVLREGKKYGDFEFIRDTHPLEIADEWIEHYEKIIDELPQFIFPTITNSLDEIFTLYELLRYNKVFTKNGNISQKNVYIQNIKNNIFKKVNDKKITNEIFKNLKKLWVSVNQELSDEKFFYKLIYIYYMDIDEFMFYDGQMIDPISEYYGDFVAHLEFP